MPRKRRRIKARLPLPQALSEISLCERALWHGSGPLLEADVERLSNHAPYRLWPTWGTWAAFYAAVREELYSARPWRREASAAERLYVAHLAGDDLDVVREQIESDRRAADPRRLLMGVR